MAVRTIRERIIMKNQYSSHVGEDSVSHVRSSARGMRKNYNLHVDSSYQSQKEKTDLGTAYGSGWILLEDNSPYLYDGAGVRAHWDSYMEHSCVVELEGIYHALQTIDNHHYGIIHETNHLTIYCDNNMVEYIMNRRLKGHKPPLYAFDTVERIMEYQHKVHMNFVWEKGHLDNNSNNIADRMAFLSRKSLQRHHHLGSLFMETLVFDILDKNQLADSSLHEHIFDENRRLEICRSNGTVELTYEVKNLPDDKRDISWYAFDSDGLHVGSFVAPIHGGSMSVIQIANHVLSSYKNSEFYDENKYVYFSVPMKRTLIDGIVSVHTGRGKPKDSRSVNSVGILKESLDTMKIQMVQSRNSKVLQRV